MSRVENKFLVIVIVTRTSSKAGNDFEVNKHQKMNIEKPKPANYIFEKTVIHVYIDGNAGYLQVDKLELQFMKKMDIGNDWVTRHPVVQMRLKEQDVYVRSMCVLYKEKENYSSVYLIHIHVSSAICSISPVGVELLKDFLDQSKK